ncbi:MAG: hypothetical protein K8R69_06625 [Deltaproteobacteria bacterium]|nr:hypothetical protein [Deltaproteobacteria bacterium]
MIRTTSAIFFAPHFVREKTRTVPRYSCNSFSSKDSFISWRMMKISCSMSADAVPAGATSRRTGSAM